MFGQFSFTRNELGLFIDFELGGLSQIVYNLPNY